MTSSHSEPGEWIHQGNRYAHAEDFKCSGCGRHASLSNMSDRYQSHGEPEPCDCWGDGE